MVIIIFVPTICTQTSKKVFALIMAVLHIYLVDTSPEVTVMVRDEEHLAHYIELHCCSQVFSL